MYNTYSDYLVGKYGEKIYKLPINLPVTCPNRINQPGCSFCSSKGTGFEAQPMELSVTEQLTNNRNHIQKKYKAKKYIAYFQNYTNTFIELSSFKKYLLEAAVFPDLVGISISTRPDCISEEYLDFLKEIKKQHGLDIMIEYGLQTVNYHTLDKIQRGHGLGAFLAAVLLTKKYDFDMCAHVILNLPGDTLRDSLETANIISALPIKIVKIHSLYIPKDTLLCQDYNDGKIELCDKEEYYNRLQIFLENIKEDTVVERIFSRVPEEDAVFSNWGTSWWKLKDEFMEHMKEKNSYQGKSYEDLNAKGLKKLIEC